MFSVLSGRNRSDATGVLPRLPSADDLKKQLTQWASANKTVSSKWKAMKRLYKYELVEDEGTTIKLPSARRVACEKLEQTPEHKALVERFNEMFPPDSITLSGKHISKVGLAGALLMVNSLLGRYSVLCRLGY